MTLITLTMDEVESAQLPKVCIQCGKPSKYEKRVVFDWHPLWIDLSASLFCMGVLFYIPLLRLFHKKRVVHAPVCELHRGYGDGITTTMLTNSVVVFSVLLCVFVMFGMRRMAGGDLIALVVFMSVISLISLILLHTMWRSIFCNVVRITNKEITLKNVHPNFIATIEAHRKSAEQVSE